MVVWVLAQSFCFPVAFYFLRLYLLESDYKLIEFDLIQKVLLVPSLLFGTILSSRLYVLDLSEEIFSLKYKPFRFFFVLTIIYFGLFLVIVVVGKMNDLNLFTSFSLLIILLYSLLELIKFAYGHISNYFYFFGSSYILLLFEIVLALTWFFSAKANLDLHYLLFVVMGAYFSTSVILYRMQGRLRIKL
jgi:hypothetical protein